MLTKPRSRTWYAVAALITIFAGLASRTLPRAWPEVLSKYPGDSLWALMVFFGWGTIFSKTSTVLIGIMTLGTCFLIEVLKLYQAPWIMEFRHTTVGHLLLGHVFSWGNHVAYTVRTVDGTLIDGYFRCEKQR